MSDVRLGPVWAVIMATLVMGAAAMIHIFFIRSDLRGINDGQEDMRGYFRQLNDRLEQLENRVHKIEPAGYDDVEGR